MNERQLPFFVYGTLRAGQHNHKLAAGLIGPVQPATLHGHTLYSDYGLPRVADTGPGSSLVLGDLLTARPGAYPELLGRLDRLEGYKPGTVYSHYLRRARSVVLAGGSRVTAWVYLAGEHIELRAEDIVPDGDYPAAERRFRAEMEARYGSSTGWYSTTRARLQAASGQAS